MSDDINVIRLHESIEFEGRHKKSWEIIETDEHLINNKYLIVVFFGQNFQMLLGIFSSKQLDAY